MKTTCNIVLLVLEKKLIYIYTRKTFACSQKISEFFFILTGKNRVSFLLTGKNSELYVFYILTAFFSPTKKKAVRKAVNGNTL